MVTEQERRVTLNALREERANLEAQIAQISNRLEYEKREDDIAWLETRKIEAERGIAVVDQQIDLYSDADSSRRAPRKAPAK